LTVNELIQKLEELKGRDLDNGDLPVVLGLTGETIPDEVFVEHYDGDPKLPYVRVCSVKDERLGPGTFGRFS
jgi:hypothetical protein